MIHPNHLRRGLVFYMPQRSLAPLVGSDRFQAVGPVVFERDGPVAGEGALVTGVSPVAYVRTHDVGSFSGFTGQRDFLFSLWFYPTESGGSQLLVVGETRGDGADIYLDGDLGGVRLFGEWQVVSSKGNNFENVSADTNLVTLNDWNHALFWFVAKQKTAFIQLNGGDTSSASASTIARKRAPKGALSLGGPWPPSPSFHGLTGKIGPLGIWHGTIPDASDRSRLAERLPFKQFRG